MATSATPTAPAATEGERDFDQPRMACPRCRREYDDFDGVGVVYCDPLDGGCGYCRHMSRSGTADGKWRCDFCGQVTP